MANISSIGGNPIIPVAVQNNSVTDDMLKQMGGVLERTAGVIDAHNALADGFAWHVTSWEVGAIDASGNDGTNSDWLRTGFVDLSSIDFHSIYKSEATTAYLFEYDSSKGFIKRDTLSLGGSNLLTLDANAAYIRVSTPNTVNTQIVVKPPYAQKRDVSVLSRGITNMSLMCIHHDNFSRTMTGWEIGKNSEGALTDNSYNLVTGSTDDGIRVDDGLTKAADGSLPTFTLREVAAEHSNNFMVEFNAPENGKSLMLVYDFVDASNFHGIEISHNGTRYNCVQRAVQANAFKQTVSKNVYNSDGQVIQMYFMDGIASMYIDDKFACDFEVEKVSSRVAFGAYKSYAVKLDFLNVFDVITPLIYNTEYLTDSGVSTLPNSTLSANADRYALDGTTTRFSEKSEKFMLYSTDEKISNGRRTERSLVALLPNNLRTMRYEFDVYFPSSILPDTDTSGYGDIFFQLHDRQTGVSRGAVPFHLSLVGSKIRLTQCASATQAAGSLDTITSGFDCGEVTYDQWMHFEFYIKERYEVEQHPFMELRIDGKVVYQSRKPNCANDVKGTSAQYGEYKNNFDLITYSERYIDNFKVTY